jgi:hypothetical protein
LRDAGLEAAKDYASSPKLSWLDWLLSQIYSELLQDCQTHYGSSEERGEIYLEY